MEEKVPYVERMRRSGMKQGNCGLCSGFTTHLEFHHEVYRPTRGMYLCHNCHHKVHRTPYRLTEQQKRKLLIVRLQTPKGIDEAKFQSELKLYKPPRKSN